MSPQPRRPPAPPELMDELLGEILFRIPPDEPAHLVHAALLCKPWLRVLSDPVSTAATASATAGCPSLVSSTTSTSTRRARSPASSPPPPLPARSRRSTPATAGCSSTGSGLTTSFCGIPSPASGSSCRSPLYPLSYYTGAVSAVAGCDHLDCTLGPFRVVFVVGTDDHECITWASVKTDVAIFTLEIKSRKTKKHVLRAVCHLLVESAGTTFRFWNLQEQMF
nr:uncharacterized protein LOC117843009 isoform X2 [Setaria viridis]